MVTERFRFFSALVWNGVVNVYGHLLFDSRGLPLG